MLFWASPRTICTLDIGAAGTLLSKEQRHILRLATGRGGLGNERRRARGCQRLRLLGQPMGYHVSIAPQSADESLLQFYGVNYSYAGFSVDISRRLSSYVFNYYMPTASFVDRKSTRLNSSHW